MCQISSFCFVDERLVVSESLKGNKKVSHWSSFFVPVVEIKKQLYYLGSVFICINPSSSAFLIPCYSILLLFLHCLQCSVFALFVHHLFLDTVDKK
mmetsp:Transcript_1664/g.2636  ORF Transcript_1664/g.2636 Transcript_1664/m.2636 type:complete len:96 (-) Transcript_1664:568-855(-)